jgi:hypothetical protein
MFMIILLRSYIFERSAIIKIYLGDSKSFFVEHKANKAFLFVSRFSCHFR